MFRLGFHCAKNILKHGTSHVQAPSVGLLKSNTAIISQHRTTSFFGKTNAKDMWKSVLTVSNAGKRRGRGNAIKKKVVTDLNKGQVIGVGKKNVKFPGLNTQLLVGHDVAVLEELPTDSAFQEKLLKIRNESVRKKRVKILPLERGWSGRKIPGRYLGPLPDCENELEESFESVVLEMKNLNQMTAVRGRIRSQGVMLVMGNGNGLLGISVGKSSDMRAAVKKAQKRAMKRLIHYKLEDSHTINHDFFYQFGKTKLFAYKRPPGYGLVCHRGIAECCKLIGIKDMYAKVEGAKNKQNIIKAFLLGLLEQKTYQQIADEKKLHLVEFRNEKLNFPTVLASPTQVAKTVEDEPFQQYVMGGRLPLKMNSERQTQLDPDYAKFLNKTHYRRNHADVRSLMLARDGTYKSYLSDIYDECKLNLFKTMKEKEK